MALRFVFGRSGVGKSKYLRDSVIKYSIENPETNYIIMVPEQSNLQTQTEYVSSHPRGGILNIDVLSFKRLAYKIFGEVGGFKNKTLDESGKMMILKKVIKESHDKLLMLQKPLERMDSLDKIKSIISEFSQYHVTKDTFADVIEQDVFPGLSYKLKDLVTVYEDYLEYISKEFITDEQVMDVLAEKIPLSDYVKNTVFIFDEYTGFTFLQNEVLRQLIKHAKDVVVSLTMDISLVNESVVPEHNLFALSVRTKTELTGIAIEEKVKINKAVCLSGDSKNKADEFVFMERNLFNYAAESYKEKTDRIVICESSSCEKEILYLRSMIAKLVREEGYSYRDIAVVTGDLNKYGIHFEKKLKEAGIPCFVDDSKSLINNSFPEAIRALISIANEDFSYNSVFRFLRNNLSDFSANEVDKLENYCIARGLRSYKAWENKWEKCIKNQSVEELTELNVLRSRFVSQIQEFIFVMKSKTSSIQDKVTSLYSYLFNLNCEGRLAKMAEAFEASGDYIRSVEYKQIYAAVIHLFEELVELMGNEIVSGEEFFEILDAGFSAIKIGVLPPVNDYIVLADVERSRIGRTKVLFLLGANEGIIPKNNEKVGFLNESERLVLKDSKVVLAPTSHEEYYTQKYYLYRMLNKASEKLFISYSTGVGDGDELTASYVVKNIADMFPESIFVNTDNYIGKVDFMETKADAYDYLMNGKHGEEPYWESLYEYLLKTNEYHSRLTGFQQGKVYTGNDKNLGEYLAEKLFLNNEVLYTSVSRLEQFAACPFSHYLRYGLDLQERITPEMAAVDYGNVFHSALEQFINTLKELNLDIVDVDDEMVQMYSDKCIKDAFTDIYRGYNEPTARDKYHIRRMIRLMARTIWAMKKQFADSSFKITSVEKTFDGNNSDSTIRLNNNKKAVLRGKIDRIDSFNDGEKEYVRIVDYKSGATKFSLLQFYYGIQLQLIVYLDIVKGIKKSERPECEVIPCGAFYYSINDPVISTDKLTRNATVESEILKELRLKGYRNSEVDGESDKAVDGDDLNRMLKHGKKLVEDISNDLISGKIDAAPYNIDGKDVIDACGRCNFRQVCLFDRTLPWCEVRKFNNYKDFEILEMLRESEGAEDEVD